MSFTLLTPEEIAQLSEEALHVYLQGVKSYVTSLKHEVTRKSAILDTIEYEALSQDKSVLSDRNKILVEDLKSML